MTSNQFTKEQAPFQLFPYKDQLILQTRFDLRAFVPFTGNISQSLYKKRNLSVDVKDIAQKETDLLYPAFCIEGDYGYIFYYDVETKLVNVVKYHLKEETIFRRQTINFSLGSTEVIRQLYAYTHNGQVVLAYLKETSTNNRSIIQTKIHLDTLSPVTVDVTTLNIRQTVASGDIVGFKYFGSTLNSRGRIYYFLRGSSTLRNATAFVTGSEGFLSDNNVVRLREPAKHIQGIPNAETLYDYYEWSSIDGEEIDVTDEFSDPPYSLIMWSPQTGFFITGLNGEVEGHFGANLVPLEAENTVFPKMSYYGEIHTYWQEDRKGKYYQDPNEHTRYHYDPYNRVTKDYARKRYTKKYFFPVLESGQIETEVTDDPQQTDNLLLPPIYTRPFRPLGVKIVSYCYDCNQIEIANIGNQMVLAGATIDYYDSIKFTEKFFLEKPNLELVRNPEAWRLDTTQYLEPTYQKVSDGSIKSFDYKPKYEYGISFPEIQLTAASSGAVRATNTTSGAGKF